MIRNKLFVIGIFIFLIQSISASNFYYDIGIYSENNSIEIQSVKVIFSQDNLDNFFNENFNKKIIKIKSDEKILEESCFSIPNKEIFDTRDLETGIFIEGRVNELGNFSFNLHIPYYENGKEIVIINENGDEIAKKYIDEYLKLDEDIGKKIESVKERDLVERKVSSIKKINVFEWILFIILLLLILYLVYYIIINKNLKKRK